MMNILDPNQSYTFSKIFELKINPKNIAQYFGYSFARKKLNFNQYKGALERLEQLQGYFDYFAYCSSSIYGRG